MWNIQKRFRTFSKTGWTQFSQYTLIFVVEADNLGKQSGLFVIHFVPWGAMTNKVNAEIFEASVTTPWKIIKEFGQVMVNLFYNLSVDEKLSVTC